MLWIRISFNADPDPVFFNADTDPGSRDLMTKNCKKFPVEIKFIFWSNIAIYLSLGLQKERPSHGRSRHPSKENMKTWIFFYCRSFWPSWIRIQPTKMNADSDPQHWFFVWMNLQKPSVVNFYSCLTVGCVRKSFRPRISRSVPIHSILVTLFLTLFFSAQVIKGMDVVRKIESNKTDGRDKPVKEVIMTLLFPFDSAVLHSMRFQTVWICIW